ncbi:MAG: DNA primase [Burkholderiales bacterium]|nr:DNA primase [Burkholderiales bacterium]
MIPPSFIQDLLARADIVELVGRHVQLKKSGANYMGLCPFHGEKSPSFSVSPTKQFYYCFGCHASGDALRFLTEYAGMSFTEAVHDLAQQVGLQVPEDDADPRDKERAKALKAKQATLSDVLAKAAKHYYEQLKTSERAKSYLQGRGLSGEICRRFRIGYAPPGWKGLASVFPSYDDPLLVESGLVIVQGEGEDAAAQKRYDRFRDRIMFPIRSVQGEVIGFGGRVLDQGQPKYLNSPETPVFSKGRELYGLYEARAAIRDKGYALVVEGYMDVVALAQHGLPNAVATLGTACTADHVHKLVRHTERIVFSFDGDAAGRRAAARALEAALPHASDTRSIKFLFLPPEHDPDSYIREHGSAAFEACVEQAVPLSRQFVEQAAEGCELDTAEGRARLLTQARSLWEALPDGALRRQLLRELAERTHLAESDLLDLWRPAASGRTTHRAGPPDDTPWGPPHDEPSGMHDSGPGPDPGRASSDWQGAGSQPTGRRGGEGWRGRGRWRRGDADIPMPTTPRRAPASPPDNALRMLLAHSEWWAALSAPDHQLLHELPAPHGELFTWLERHLEHHGPAPWAELSAALGGHDQADFATRLMSAVAAGEEPQLEDLQRVLQQLWIDELSRRSQALIAAAASDPAALQQLRQTHEELARLKAALRGATPPAGGSGG